MFVSEYEYSNTGIRILSEKVSEYRVTGHSLSQPSVFDRLTVCGVPLSLEGLQLPGSSLE